MRRCARDCSGRRRSRQNKRQAAGAGDLVEPRRGPAAFCRRANYSGKPVRRPPKKPLRSLVCLAFVPAQCQHLEACVHQVTKEKQQYKGHGDAIGADVKHQA